MSQSKRASSHLIRVLRDPITLLAIALFIIFTALYTDKFLSPVSISSILRMFAIVSLLAIGPTFVVLMGSLDMTYVGIWMLGGILVWLLFPYLGMPTIFTYIIFGAIIGLLNGVLFAKGKIPSFLITLAMLAILGYMTTAASGGMPKSVPEYSFLRVKIASYIPSTFLLALPVIAAALYVFYFTKVGTYLSAIGSNEEGAGLAGINVTKYKILAFVISGLITGAGSMIIFVDLGCQSPISIDFSRDVVGALVAIVMGGTPLVGGVGGPHRTLLGALAYVLIYHGLIMSGLDPFTLRLAIGATLLAAVIVASRGLKGVIIA